VVGKEGGKEKGGRGKARCLCLFERVFLLIGSAKKRDLREGGKKKKKRVLS